MPEPPCWSVSGTTEWARFLISMAARCRRDWTTDRPAKLDRRDEDPRPRSAGDRELAWNSPHAKAMPRDTPHTEVMSQGASNHLLSEKAGAAKNGNQGHVSSSGRYALRLDTCGSKRDYQCVAGVGAFDCSDWAVSKCFCNVGSVSAAYFPATSDLLASVRYSAMSFL